jgi:hypothetical protein
MQCKYGTQNSDMTADQISHSSDMHAATHIGHCSFYEAALPDSIQRQTNGMTIGEY